jgi:glutaredoxin
MAVAAIAHHADAQTGVARLTYDTLTQFQSNADFQWREVDIDADPELRLKYNDQVPVVFVDGRKSFKYDMDGHELLRALAGIA